MPILLVAVTRQLALLEGSQPAWLRDQADKGEVQKPSSTAWGSGGAETVKWKNAAHNETLNQWPVCLRIIWAEFPGANATRGGESEHLKQSGLRK